MRSGIPDFADIVKHAADAQGLHFFPFQPHFFPHGHGQVRYPGGMSLGIMVFGLHGVGQRKEYILDVGQAVIVFLTSNQRFRASEDLDAVDRLGNEIIGPAFHSLHPGIQIVQGGDEDNRNQACTFSWDLRRRQTSNPLSPGIITSRRTKSTSFF